jgi:hypothetical protein
MKKFLFIAVLGLFLFSCTKATESNLIGTWRVTAYTDTGISYPVPANVEIELKKDGTFNYYENSAILTSGVWSLDKNNQLLTMDGEVWTVIEKKGKTLRISISTEEYTFEKQ